MSAYLEMFWFVLCHSRKTQLAITLGFVFFFGIQLMGQMLVGGIEMHGPLAALTELIRHKLMHRYDHAAWVALGTFALLAIKCYRNDYRRLLGM
jgi:hypothetical protein